MTKQTLTPLKAIGAIASILIAVVTNTPPGESHDRHRRFSGKGALDNQRG